MNRANEDAAYVTLPRKRVGAGALTTDTADCVLMVEPTYKDVWEIPGGAVEDGETAVAACRRECLEELGVDLEVGRLLVLEHQTDPVRGDSIMFVYDGGTQPDLSGVTLRDDELRSARFLASSELSAVTSERLARRIRYALEARHSGTVVELIDGTPHRPSDRQGAGGKGQHRDAT